MTKSTLALASLILALIAPLKANAACDLDYQICTNTCSVKHLTDDGAAVACKTKCAGSKGVCLAKVGADKTAEASKKAWDNTKSFFGELTKD